MILRPLSASGCNRASVAGPASAAMAALLSAAKVCVPPPALPLALPPQPARASAIGERRRQRADAPQCVCTSHANASFRMSSIQITRAQGVLLRAVFWFDDSTKPRAGEGERKKAPLTRGSIRKQSRKTLPAKRRLLRYRVLHSTKECCAPLPCICRFAAVLRCFAVFAKPLFSYCTALFCTVTKGARLAFCILSLRGNRRITLRRSAGPGRRRP